MANKEILLVAEVVSNEKGISKDELFDAIEQALASATAKRYPHPVDIKVTIDKATGDYDTVRRWLVVDPDAVVESEENDNLVTSEDDDNQSETHAEYCPHTTLTLEAAQEQNQTIQIGEFIEEPVESVEFGRIAAQTAKQVIIQKVREAERLKIYEQYKDRVGELIVGVVKRTDRKGIYLDLGGNAEAFVPRSEMIPRESARMGDRLRGYLKAVRPETRGPQIFISRTAPELLIELFKLEVPEASEGVIEILGAARDPGVRAKLAVRSHDSRLDPVGACVGMRGSRVQAVSGELGGERVDIILWDETPAQYVINALSPAEIESIVVDEDAHSMDIAVGEDSLSIAIGRGGQNVRLAAQLTGWNLNVMDQAQATDKQQAEASQLMTVFMDKLDVDEDVASVLVAEGFTTVDEIAYVPMNELVQIEDFDQDTVEELRNRARDALLIDAITSEEKLEDAEPAQDLLELEGMQKDLAFRLAAAGIKTAEDLAECAIDDLAEIEALDKELAGQLIMKAREPWFAEQND
ncbi:MAG TPA: transcription termination/antitermination protein NusA [Crenotrichaceae bacterium]|nr:transcription termination/antitermination protein NusA [Crenotrichaceae bacterium]